MLHCTLSTYAKSCSFVCAISKETRETVCFTSYRKPQGNDYPLDSVTIWEACWATSAASSFFKSISLGAFCEEFVDGSLSMHNPVRELWDQAQLVWGPQPLERRIKCLLSIGTGIQPLKPFEQDMPHMSKMFSAIATEIERTAQQFLRERQNLDITEWYYRFNVAQGLKEIGLEEATDIKEVTALMRKYRLSDELHKQIQAFKDNMAERRCQYRLTQQRLRTRAKLLQTLKRMKRILVSKGCQV